MTVLVDYGVGNLYSLISSLTHIGYDCLVSGDIGQIARADRLILPGVGAFEGAAAVLDRGGYTRVLQQKAAEGVPFLGICLGMQLLFDRSYEFGCTSGLSLIKGDIMPMRPKLDEMELAYKLPQMGWNALSLKKPHPLTKYIADGAFVYYVHSYYAATSADYIVAASDYGVLVPGIVAKGNVMGCQFHPEKSGEVGLCVLRAFMEI